MNVIELAAELVFKGGKEAAQQMKSLMETTKGAKVALNDAVNELYKMSEAARETAFYLELYKTNTGQSGEELQRLSYQATQAGVSMQELGGTIQRIQQMSMNVRLGKGDASPFVWLGIDPNTADPVNTLRQVGAELRRLHAQSPAAGKNFADMWGLSDTMYYSLLNDTNDELNERFLMTEQEQQEMVKLNKEWNKLWFYIKQVSIKFQAVSGQFQTKIVKILINAVQGAGELLYRFWDLINANEKLKYVLLAVGAVLLAYMSPWTAVLAGVALILDDIFAYFNGGDSLTGRLIEWCKASERMQEIWLGLKTVFDMLVGTFGLLKDAWDMFIEPMLQSMSKSKYLMEIIRAVTNPAGTMLQLVGKGRKMYDENFGEVAKPSVSNAGGVTDNRTQNNTYNITGTNAQEIADRVEESQVSNAMMQSPELSYAQP